jgi:hypothetical protein
MRRAGRKACPFSFSAELIRNVDQGRALANSTQAKESEERVVAGAHGRVFRTDGRIRAGCAPTADFQDFKTNNLSSKVISEDKAPFRSCK